MFDLIAAILAWIYSVVGDLGWSIVILTLLVMIVMTPLTLSSTRSMIKMQRLQPEMKRIQQQYKDDRERMNQEMMAFYQENNVNPLGGCLPLFFQMPVFLVLYRVVSGLTRRQVSDGADSGAATVVMPGADAGQVPEIELEREFNPQYLDESTDLFEFLSENTEILFFFDIFDLALTPIQAITDSVVRGVPYVLLLLLVLASSLYQQRQIQGRSSGQVNPQQQMIMRIMPWFLPFISLSLATALTLYFVASNVYRIGQQAYITRTLYGDKDADEAEAGPAKKKSGGGKDEAISARSEKAAANKAKNQADIENRRRANEAARSDGGGTKKPRSRSQNSNNQSGKGTPGSGGGTRKGAGAGRPRPRSEPTPSSRTGGSSPRNKKKKRN